MGDKIEIEKVIESYNKSKNYNGRSDELKTRSRNKIEPNKLVKKFEIEKPVETSFVLRPGCKFRLIVYLEREFEDLRLRFIQRNPLFLFEEERPNELILTSRKNSPKKFIFETESLYLDPSKYGIELIDIENEQILGNLMVDVYMGERKLPKKSVFVESKNDSSKFPDGNFLLMNSKNKKIKENLVSIVTDRKVLEEIDSAYLFKNGKFDKIVKGDEKWCLLSGSER